MKEEINLNQYTQNFNETLIRTISPILKEEIKRFEGEPFDGEMLFPETINTVFSTVLLIYNEACNCFFDNYYNGSAALCRAAIDSGLYVASTRELTSKRGFNFNVGHLLNSKGKINDVNWTMIKEGCLESGILNEKELKSINLEIREKGNLALHFIEKQDQLIAASLQENNKFINAKLPDMRKMFELEQKELAKQVLDKTGYYLIEVFKSYFRKYSNVFN